jgi:hypothetical protein
MKNTTDIKDIRTELMDEVTLKEYFENLLCQYKEAHEKEHRLLAENVELAREGMEKRLESMNEFRAQILNERSHMVSIDKFEGKMNEFEAKYFANHKRLEDRVDILEKTPGNTATAAWKWVLGVIGAIIITAGISLAINIATRPTPEPQQIESHK